MDACTVVTAEEKADEETDEVVTANACEVVETEVISLASMIEVELATDKERALEEVEKDAAWLVGVIDTTEDIESAVISVDTIEVAFATDPSDVERDNAWTIKKQCEQAHVKDNKLDREVKT